MNKWLFTHIDNTGLTLWRIVFGLLIAVEGFGAIATGWVRRTMVEPEFTFNFIGFEFLQPLPGNGMYFYFALMGTFGVLVMLGYKYRFAMFSYALMWTCVYLMQKTSYNNHYYLMMLLCWLMVFLPAHRWFSLDAWRNPAIKSSSVPRWTYLMVIGLVWVVYTYASIAKMYPDWLDGTVTRLFMAGKKNYWGIGGFLQLNWVHHAMGYFGILFDLLIVPLLLMRRTRLLGFAISVFFHLFNSIVFQIGIFPYMSMAFAFFFFSSELLQKRFLPKKELYTKAEVHIPKYKPILITAFSIFFAVQIALPLRHWIIEDDVLWTEEGHRLSWRMMLRTKGGRLTFKIKDKATGEMEMFKHRTLLSKKQQRSIRTKPDMIWQLAQRIKKLEAEKGRDVGVYVESKVKVNGGDYFQFIDPKVDLTSVPWKPLSHSDWLLPSPEEYQPQKKEKAANTPAK